MASHNRSTKLHKGTPTSVDAQTIVLPPTTAAPSGGDSREAGTRTARSLSYSPHKFPRLTGMSDDFSHARAATAARAAISGAGIIRPDGWDQMNRKQRQNWKTRHRK